jgi:protein TonB
MFERAEVRRGSRAVSFALAALAHGLLLLSAVLLVRKHVAAERPEIIVDVRQPRSTVKPPPGTSDTASGKRTHPPRKRPPPAPRDLDHVKPPPALEPEIQPEPEAEPAGPEGEERGAAPIGTSNPNGNPDGDCIGPGCGAAIGPRPVDEVQIGQPGVERPRPLCDPPAPTMPEQARIMGITGAVMMRYVVEPDGSVSGVHLLNSDAPPVLVEAVRDWLAHCRFTPAVANGRQVRIRWDRPFLFKLH